MATASCLRRSAFRRREVIEGLSLCVALHHRLSGLCAFPMIWAFVLMFRRYNPLRPPCLSG